MKITNSKCQLRLLCPCCKLINKFNPTKAEARKTELESEMTDALRWEKSIQQLFEGLECSDKILTARLEHDLCAEDLPSDSQVSI
jgi:hypothetical protein